MGTKYGIWVERPTSSVVSPEKGWVYYRGQVRVMDTKEEAERIAQQIRDAVKNPKIKYTVKEMPK